ncbi:unnamed protein product [Symbiodinium sp. CCMP2592]|nr:unnamed protein product [Symbiodinium sp. CCMP2592]
MDPRRPLSPKGSRGVASPGGFGSPAALALNDVDTTVMAYAQWLSELQQQASQSRNSQRAELDVLRDSIAAQGGELAEFKRHSMTVVQHLQNQEVWKDGLCIKEHLTPVADDMVDRGWLRTYKLKGTGTALITPGLPKAFSRENADAQQAKRDVIFHYQVDNTEDDARDNFTIPQEAIPAFLAHNGIEVIGSQQLRACIQRHLKGTMSLLQCRVVGEYSLSKYRHGMMLSAVDTIGVLKPGDVALFLKMDLNYADEYLTDPTRFTDRLKHEIMEAVFTQNLPDLPESSRKFLENLKPVLAQHIHIRAVSQGSIEVIWIASGAFFICFAFVAALLLGRDFKVSGGIAGVADADLEACAQPRVQMARTVSLRVQPDGSYRITGTYYTDAPAGRCAIL